MHQCVLVFLFFYSVRRVQAPTAVRTHSEIAILIWTFHFTKCIELNSSSCCCCFSTIILFTLVTAELIQNTCTFGCLGNTKKRPNGRFFGVSLRIMRMNTKKMSMPQHSSQKQQQQQQHYEIELYIAYTCSLINTNPCKSHRLQMPLLLLLLLRMCSLMAWCA